MEILDFACTFPQDLSRFPCDLSGYAPARKCFNCCRYARRSSWSSGASGSLPTTNTFAPRPGSKCPVPVPTYTAATQPANRGFTTTLGTMYFLAFTKDSTTPWTGVLRGMLPGTCAITILEN